MPKFTMLLRGTEPVEVSYTPIIVIAGSVAHKLALHKNPNDVWVVSDPKSGAKVCVVHGQYKGIRTSSSGLTKRELRMFAVHSVEMIINRIGSDKFNEVLANPKPF